MMHSYSVDFKRSKIALAIGVIAVFAGSAAELAITKATGVGTFGLPILTLAGGLYWLVDRWLWKYPPLTWVHPIPNLEGEWKGEIESSHGSPDGDELTPIEPDGSRLKITQRWSKMEINYRNSDSSSSRSVSARIESDTSWPKLTYVYENEPKGDGIETSQKPHGGTAVLDFYEDEGHLRGKYYNDRSGGQSHGEMRFERTDD